MSDSRTVLVAVDVFLNENLTYSQNENFSVERGDVVLVPLGAGNKSQLGVVLKTNVPAPAKPDGKLIKLKPVTALHKEWPRIPETHLLWLEWLAEYYIYPLGEIVSLCMPKLLKPGKKITSKKPPVVPSVEITVPHKLNTEQQTCVDAIWNSPGFSTHLVHGVTGSGKTEIYLELFEKTMAAGKRGLFLLPEISLTPQLVQRFSKRFGNEIAVLHSQLSPRERTNQWWDVSEGRKKILVGARSAVFCPIDNLGLIVVDEEHESSFKQESDFKYHGRDAAIMLGKFHNCPVILGSATPSIESWNNATEKKYVLHQIKNRVNNRPLPDIEIVDMRVEKDLVRKNFEKPNWLSQKLYEEIIKTLDDKKQVALLLNRRGVAQSVFCPSCGHTAECPNCDISLSLHANTHLICHYCDYHENMKTKCPQCKEGERVNLGLGTEKVEEDLKSLFPGKVIARADRDEISSREEMEELVKKMEDSEIDILIGTQMIAKGLDFSNLNLVGLLLADISFNLPDFRATERSFQLITQMSGRAGRHVKENEAPGKVFIQTYNTTHESIIFSQNHDYEGFAATELMHRRQLNYPPFHKLASIRIQSPKIERVEDTCNLLTQRANALKSKFEVFKDIEVLGPVAAPIAKLRNEFRYHVLLKSAQPKALNQFIRKLIGDSKWASTSTKLIVDVDPLNLL